MTNSHYGMVGSAILVLGSFCPVIRAPIMGSLSLAKAGEGDGVILALLSVIALIVSAKGSTKFLWVTGLFGALEIVHVIYFMQVRYPELLEQYRSRTQGNIFAGLADTILSSVELEWGVGVLAIGSAISLMSAREFWRPQSAIVPQSAGATTAQQ